MNKKIYQKNRVERYKANVNGIRDRARQRSHVYYNTVAKKRMEKNKELYRELTKTANAKKYSKRKELLRRLRVEKGGKCAKCNYNEEVNILQFHHLGEKIDSVSSIQSLKKIEDEAKKCILLCPNCHALTHLRK